MNARRSVAASLALLCLLGTASWGPVAEAHEEPRERENLRVRILDAPPAPLDPAAFPELTLQRLRNDAVGVQARMAYLPGTGDHVAALNARIDELIRSTIRQQGGDYTPVVEARGAGLSARGCLPGSTLLPASEVLSHPELGPPAGSGAAVVCDIVAAQGPFFGERLRVVVGTASEQDSDSSVVIYVDTATGETATAEDLWQEGAAAALHGDLVEAIRREAGALSRTPYGEGAEEQEDGIRAALATTVPAAEGAMAFTVPAELFVADPSGLGIGATQETFTVEVPAELVARLATAFGRRLAAASGRAFDGPDAVPAGREWVDCTLLPCLALTYDDGPSAHTPRLLDELEGARAAATFYVLGSSASRLPGTVSRAAAEGHEIGAHTWSHPHMTRLTDAGIRSQLKRTRSLLRTLSGQPVATFRPPYGDVDRRVLKVAGLPAVLWTVDTRDWAGPSDRRLLREAIDEPEPGGIVLFHDTQEQTVALAPEIISELRDRGFTLVTVTQLFDGDLPRRGAWRGAP